MTATVLAYLPSPDQGVWHIGAVPIRGYALCILAGIVAALIIGDRRWTARGGEPGVIYDIALWAVPFGLLGGRVYHVITDWTTYFGDGGKGLVGALRIWDGGLGIWGAVALGGVGAWIACRRRGIPLPAFGDAIAPGIVLAQAIGRLGNYFNQELYGRPTTMPWGLEIYERRNASGALDSLNGVSTGQLVGVVHPTFLYELLWNLVVFGVLILVDRRFKIGHGRLFALYVAGYCVGRFWIELMRSDYATTIGDTGIRVNSFTSTFVFVGAVVYIILAPKGREAPETLRGNDVDEDRESAFDELGEELTAVAATSGVVAAATVAAADEEPEGAPELDESVGSDESETAAEAEPQAEEVETPSSEDESESEPDGESEAEPEDGLGSVEGDEVAEARDEAAEVHEAAVEGVGEAESLAEDVAGEDDAGEPDAEPEPDGVVESEAEPEEGLGSVEGVEVAEARDEAAEVHEAAVEGVGEAESLAEDVAGEDDAGEPDAEPEPDGDRVRADLS